MKVKLKGNLMNKYENKGFIDGKIDKFCGTLIAIGKSITNLQLL
jgi:hypothetical protein